MKPVSSKNRNNRKNDLRVLSDQLQANCLGIKNYLVKNSRLGVLIVSIALFACNSKVSKTKEDVKTQKVEEVTQLVAPVKPIESKGIIKSNVYKKGKAESVVNESNVDYEMAAPQQDAIYMKDNAAMGATMTRSCKMPAPGALGYGVHLTNHVDYNTESYNTIVENEFLASKDNPLSTFSIDVDEASYTNARRYIEGGSLPPKDAVRVEEFINYFDYHYPQPKGKEPFSFITEISTCPWNKENRLIHIGLQGKTVSFDEIAPMNMVFLIDVSGSMDEQNKLPLVKSTLKLLVNKLRAKDRISLTVYAGAAGLVLPSTSGAEKEIILDAIDNLKAGGSTAGGAGIKLAYKIAKENLIDNGVNRIILATDGDFNVGTSSDAEMTRLVEDRRDDGIFLTVLGFGQGNYKDSKMESIADNGNGNYFCIDRMDEARKVLVTDLGSTLYTIAKDVKLQIEFNPAKVKAYRLVGYENRMLKKEDFNNDKKDAGDMGAGHTVTALYEIIPADSKQSVSSVDPLKYQFVQPNKEVSTSAEIMTIKFRYKDPKESVSKLIVHPLIDKQIAIENTSENFRFSAAVAEFGMLLRDSKFKGTSGFEEAIQLASNAKGKDEEGYRAEFIKLVKTASVMKAQVSR